LFSVRPLARLVLLLAASIACQGQTPQDAAGPVLEGESFAGRPIMRIDFEPASEPILRADLDRRVMPLQPGVPFKPSDVPAAIRNLYSSGRFSNIAVDAQPDGAGVVLKFITGLNYFVSGVNIDGAADPPNREQLRAATKIELGALFSDSQIALAIQNMQDRLGANGLNRSKIDYHIDRRDDTEEASIYFVITAGPRAHFDGVDLTGSFNRPVDAIVHDTGWHRGIGFVTLPGWRDATDQRTQSGISHVQENFQKRDYLQAKVTLDSIEYHDQTNRVTPTLNIVTGPTVEVGVNGANVSQSHLRQLIPIYQERAVDRSLLLEGRTNLVQYLQSRGYFDAQVGDAEVANPESNRTVITYTAMPGERHKLVKIDITGNKYFNTETIRERLSMTPSSFLRHRAGSFSQQLLDNDKSTIADLYRSNGFRQVEVSSEVADKNSDLSVTLTIKEGPQWLIESLSLEGIGDDDLPKLRPNMQSAAGEPYSESSVAADRDSILSYYFNNGYPDAAFDFTQTPASEPTRMDLRYVVKPGRREYVKNILVRGLEATRPGLVDQRIQISPGDPISQSKIAESQQKLFDLGVFSRVETSLQNPDGDEDSKYVLIHVDEASKYALNYGIGAELGRIGGGVTTFDDPAGATGFSPRGTFGISRLNFLGIGHTIGVQTLVSTLEQRVSATYQAPQFTGNPNLSLTFSGLFDDSSDIRTFTSHRLEGSVQLSQRVSRQYSLQYRYTIRRVTINNLEISNQELVPLLSQPDRAGIFAFAFIQDRRDDPVDTHTGVYNTVDTGYAWSGFGSGTNYTRLSIRNATYHRIGRDLVLARSLQFGWIHNLGGQPVDIPLAERFFSGGASSNRAFPDNQAGPRDTTTGFPLGGNGVLFHSTELRFPLIGNNVQGVLFHDIGNVYSDVAGLTFRFRQRNIQDFNYAVNSFGFGIRYKTPIGPIRVDFSLSPDSPRFFGFSGTRDQLLAGTGTLVNQRINIFQFHFSLGQTF
jgi:outer membrane protein assembly complex protein YaeT